MEPCRHDVEITYSFPPCGSKGLNSCCQAWLVVSLYSKPSHWPIIHPSFLPSFLRSFVRSFLPSLLPYVFHLVYLSLHPFFFPSFTLDWKLELYD